MIRILLIELLLIPLSVSAGDAPEKDLASLDLEQLLNIKVTTASKFAENLADAPGVMTVVTRDEIRRFGAITLREVLDRVPGLTGTSTYFTDRSLVAARGDQTRIDGGHILILINGRPSREVLEGGIISDLLESFPVGVLERIEVIRGPGSVLYGSNAFSAVINLITRTAERNGVAIDGVPGAGGARAAAGQVALKFGDLGIVGAAQFHQAPGWAVPFGYWDPNTGAVFSQDAAMRDRGAGGYLGIGYRGLSFMSSVTGWNGTGFVGGFVGQPRWRRGFADLGYRLPVRRRWEMTFNVTYTRTTYRMTTAPNIDRDSHEVLGEWTSFIKPGDRDQITFGALVNHIQGSELYTGVRPFRVISDGGRPGGAAYAQWEHKLWERVKLLGGVQANKIGSIALDAVPRAGVIANLSSRLTLKALYGQAFRAPSINETLIDHPQLEGNPNLRPEKVQTADVSLGYQGKRLQAAISAFRSLQTDSIVIETGGSRMKYVNLGVATFRGVETEAKYYLHKHWLLLGSVLYQSNKDGNGSSNVTPIPNYQIKAGVSYEVQNGATASLFDAYQGPLDARYNGIVNPSAEACHLLTAHFRFDLSRRLGLDGRRGVALFAHAENLANRRLWLPAWGDFIGETMPVSRGRTVYFGIEVWISRE